MLKASHELLELCVRSGGVLSGEHGVGIEKRDALPLMFGEDDIAAMERIRAAWNRKGLLNPGKILPSGGGCGEALRAGRVAAPPGAWI